MKAKIASVLLGTALLVSPMLCPSTALATSATDIQFPNWSHQSSKWNSPDGKVVIEWLLTVYGYKHDAKTVKCIAVRLDKYNKQTRQVLLEEGAGSCTRRKRAVSSVRGRRGDSARNRPGSRTSRDHPRDDRHPPNPRRVCRGQSANCDRDLESRTRDSRDATCNDSDYNLLSLSSHIESDCRSCRVGNDSVFRHQPSLSFLFEPQRIQILRFFNIGIPQDPTVSFIQQPTRRRSRRRVFCNPR